MVRTKHWVIDESTFPKDKPIGTKLEFLIKYGILAASAHNSQPWIFKTKKNTITILPNNKKSLPIVDKNKRELWISLGCALKNILIAGEHFGLKGKEKITKRKIEISFKETKPKQNHLFNFITQRRTNRRKAKRTLIKKEELTKLRRLPFEKQTNAFLIDNKSDITKIFELIKEANKEQYDNSKFKKELISWMRFNPKTANKTGDGIPYYSMDLPTLPTTIGERITNYFLNSKYQNKSDEDKLKTSSGLIILTSKTDCTTCWTNTGKTLQNILLLLTSMNISYAFMNSACEITQTRDKLDKMLKGKPQIILRIGQAKNTKHTKRRPINEVLKTN